MAQVPTLGSDIAKHVMSVHGVDPHGQRAQNPGGHAARAASFRDPSRWQSGYQRCTLVVYQLTEMALRSH